MEQSSSCPRATTYLSLVQAIDDFPYGPIPSSYYQLYLPNDDEPHGYLTRETVLKMPWTSHFSVQHEKPRRIKLLDSSDGKDLPGIVNAAFSELVNCCIDQDTFKLLDGRHSEAITIASARYDKPVTVERFAAPLFGLTTRGAHLIAYTMTDEGMKLWIPRRAANLYTFPGKLDSTVAGGIKSGATPFETTVEEALEEASLPHDVVRSSARSLGIISHMGITGDAFPGEKALVLPDYIYVYDMELAKNVVPKPYDGEVGMFYCMTVADVQSALLRGEFKPDSAAVLVFFFITHGVITEDNEKDYDTIHERLRRKLPFRTDIQTDQAIPDVRGEHASLPEITTAGSG